MNNTIIFKHDYPYQKRYDIITFQILKESKSILIAKSYILNRIILE